MADLINNYFYFGLRQGMIIGVIAGGVALSFKILSKLFKVMSN